jgi:hypothetical protein
LFTISWVFFSVMVPPRTRSRDAFAARTLVRTDHLWTLRPRSAPLAELCTYFLVIQLKLLNYLDTSLTSRWRAGTSVGSS